MRSPGDPARRRRRLLWIGLFGFALGARAAAANVLQAAHPLQVYEYDEIARSIVAGQGFSFGYHGDVVYRAYVAPLYPWLCAAVYALFGGSVAAVLAIQMAADATTALLIGRLGERLANLQVGLVSGLLVACHPGLIVYSSLKAHPLAVDALCFAMVLWQLVHLQHERTVRRSIVCGLTIGLSVLSRATNLVCLPVGIAWLVLTGSRRDRKAELTRALAMAVCAGLVVAPWLIRNGLLYKRLIFQTTSWELFWRGNNPHATGHSYVDANRTVLGTLPPEALAELRGLPNELRQADWFRDRARSFILANPWAFAGLTLKKFLHFWWMSPQEGLLYPPWWRRGYQAFYGVIVCLVLLGVGYLLKEGSAFQRRVALLIGGLTLAVSLVHSMYYVEGRHRWAIEPALILMAGWGMWELQRRLGVHA